MPMHKGGKRGRKTLRSLKRKRYYERHPEKAHPSTRAEGRAFRNWNRSR